MPRPGPRRKPVPLRMHDGELTPVQTRADAETGGELSEMLRRLVAFAVPRMPVDWPNGKEEQ